MLAFPRMLMRKDYIQIMDSQKSRILILLRQEYHHLYQDHQDRRPCLPGEEHQVWQECHKVHNI